MKSTYWVLALALVLPSRALADSFGSDYTHPDLQWFTIETEHFHIHYHKGKSSSEWTARKLASIADNVYDTVTDLYAYKLSRKVNLVVRDVEENANGWARPEDDWMTIWATNLYPPHRGRSDWIKNVFYHEFAHVVSLKAANRLGKYLPLVSVTALPEIDYDLGQEFNNPGKPHSGVPADLGLSLFFPGEIAPPWYAEGVAQYAATQAGYESYDTHREMVLRTATLEGSLLTLDEMNTFTGKVSLEMEMVYNQGFNFIGFLNEKFGQRQEEHLAKSQGKRWKFNFDNNFPKLYGATREALYEEWKAKLEEKYRKLESEIKAEFHAGEEVDFFARPGEAPDPLPELKRYRYKIKGLLNRYVRFSKDGKHIAFLSTHGSDRWGTTLYLCKTEASGDEDRCSEVEDADPNSQFSFSPDSKKLYFTRMVGDATGLANELFVYDIERERIDLLEGKRSTFHFWFGGWDRTGGRPPFRSSDVDVSPNGQWVVYTENLDGQKNLRLIRPDGASKTKLSSFVDGTQIGGPQWSPDGMSIVFYMFHKDQQDIWLLDLKTLKMRPLTYDKADDRDPCFTPDGSKVIFASDRTGIFNLYELDLASSKLTQLTHVVGGAFWPSVTPDGKTIYYSYYTSYGYRFYKMDREAAYHKAAARPDVPPVTMGWQEEEALKADFPDVAAVPYRARFRPFHIAPLVGYFNEQAQIGLSGSVGDALDRHLFGLEGQLGLPDYDQFGGVFYENGSLPTRFSVGYRYFLNNEEINFGPAGTIENDFIGNTVEVDLRRPLGGDHWLNVGYTFRAIQQQYGAYQGLPTIDYFLAAQYRLQGQDPKVGCLSYTLTGSLGAGPDTSCLGTLHTPVQNHQIGLGYEFDSKTGDIEADANRRTGRKFQMGFAYTQTKLSGFVKASNFLTNRQGVVGDPSRAVKTGARPLDDYSFRRVVVDYTEYFRSPIRYFSSSLDRLSHSVYFSLFAGLQERPVSDFDKFFAGGRLNLFSQRLVNPFLNFPGYEDFSIAGDALFLASAGYGFPVVRKIHKQVGPFYLDSLFGKIFADLGNGYDMTDKGPIIGTINFDRNNDGSFDLEDLLEDVGAEIRARLEVFHYERSWYSFLRVAKGLSKAPGLTRNVDDPADPAAFASLATLQSVEKSEAPIRVYLGLGTSF